MLPIVEQGSPQPSVFELCRESYPCYVPHYEWTVTCVARRVKEVMVRRSITGHVDADKQIGKRTKIAR